tara:strand:- start:133 stop:765 length:633 start_codon:yes stop_codon:yes gene_type:complete
MKKNVKIGVIDYGVCNINSIVNMLKFLDFETTVITQKSDFNHSDKIILPGVGSFDTGVKALQKSNLFEKIINETLIQKKPILGICLGMQLLGTKSEEGKLKGLNLIQGELVKLSIPKSFDLKIPHMGWNYVKIQNQNNICSFLPFKPRFYFTHSFHFKNLKKNEIIATTEHGIEIITIIAKNNIYGTQFHPEKSHKFGLSILKAFGEKCA